MTGSTLRRLRWGFAFDSARKLARRIGVAHSTVLRNERRARVTEYVEARISAHPLASAFLLGMTGEEAGQMGLL